MASTLPFEGTSGFLRWLPKGYLLLGLAVLISRWNHSIQFATLLVVLAYLHSRWFAWRFLVNEDGIMLQFPFGRRVFLARASVTIRLEMVGAFALTGRRRRFGYPLLDHVLYQPGHEDELRDAFTRFGYDVR